MYLSVMPVLIKSQLTDYEEGRALYVLWLEDSDLDLNNPALISKPIQTINHGLSSQRNIAPPYIFASLFCILFYSFFTRECLIFPSIFILQLTAGLRQDLPPNIFKKIPPIYF